MKKFSLKPMLLLCALMVGVGSAGAADKTKWIKTAPNDLVDGDIVVIMDSTTTCIMRNDAETDAVPGATKVTLNDGKDQISVDEGKELEIELQWQVTVTDGSFQFSKLVKNESGEVTVDAAYLYATDADDGLRVGTGENVPNTFAIAVGGNNQSNFLCTKTGENDRYIGVYNMFIRNSWESRTSIDDNIKKSATVFYKKVVSSKTDVTLSFPKTDYEGDIASGKDSFTAPTATSSPEVSGITYSTSNKWVAQVNETTGAVTLNKRGTATITATYAGDDIYESATASYTLRVDDSTSEEGGSANPFSVEDAISYAEGENYSAGCYYFVKGIVSQIGSNSGSGYGGADLSSITSILGGGSTASTMTYYISDDGTTNKQLKVSTGRGPGFSDLTADMFSVGDEVIVVGPLNYTSDKPTYSVGGSGSSTTGGSTEKTARIEADNYMHKLTRRILAADKVLYLGTHKLMEDLCSLNKECETYETYKPVDTSIEVKGKSITYNSDAMEVTANTEGVDTITVSVPFKKEGQDMFTSTRRFFITVKSRDLPAGGVGAGKYYLVEKTSEPLKEGDKLLIVANESEKNYALSTSASMMGGMTGVEVTFEKDSEGVDVIAEVPDNAAVVTLKSTSDDKWMFTNGDDKALYTSVAAASNGDEKSFDIGSLLGSYIEGYNANNLRYGGVAPQPGDSVKFSITIDADAFATIISKGDSIVRYGASPIMSSLDTGTSGSSTSHSSSSTSSSSVDMNGFNLYVKTTTDGVETIEGVAVKLYRFTTTDDEYDITTSAAGYKTLVSSYDVALPEGLNAYVVSSIDKGDDEDKAMLTDVTENGLRKDVPYILKGEPNTKYTLKGIEGATKPETNLLQVSDENTTGSKTISQVYVLGTKNGDTAFYKWQGGKLGSGRVYLSSSDAARLFILLDENTTGIAEVKSETAADNRYYNLNGQLIAQPQKGLYIVNGKKTIIK